MNIMNSPSVVVNRMDISNGAFEISIRFSSKYSELLSRMFSDFTLDEIGRIKNVGPSKGIIYELEELQKTFDLGMTQISIHLSSEERKFLSHIETTDFGESCNNLINEESVRALIYADRNVDSDYLKLLDEKRGVYQISIMDPIITQWRRSMNEFPVVRFRQFLRLKDESIKILTVLPKNQLDLSYKTFFRAIENTSDQRAYLEFASDYDYQILKEF